MKQDRNGVRTAQDLERKYELSSLVGLKQAVELQELGVNKTNTTLEEFMSSTLNSINDLQQQIDGSITTYYCSGVPAIDNYPANEWATEDYPSHVGNMYYDKDTGYAYRFFLDGDTYKWVKIADSDVEEALRLASLAQDTADGKRRVFTTTPFVPYDVGDLWLYAGELYVCKTPKTAAETYNGTDWDIATKYTDDTKLNEFVSGEYADDIDAINKQIDKKAETWYQSTDPSTNWATTELKTAHIGDLWYNTAENKNYVYTPSYEWAEIDGVPDNLYDEIDGKAQIFTSQPTPPYHVGDLYVQGNSGDILVCKTERLTGTYTASEWAKASKYTDDSSLKHFIDNVYPDDLAELTNQIDTKITTWYYSGEPTLANAPANTWLEADYIKHTGDLYYDKETGYTYTFQATEGVYGWVHIVDSDIADALSVANAAQDTADNKRRIFLDTPEPPYDNGDLWLNNEEIYVCQIGKPEGELYADGDFIVGVKYTDDTLASEVANELTVVKGQVTTILEDNNEIKITFTETTNLVNELTNEVADEIATRSAMIRATSEDGLPVIELGSTESPVQTKYKNDGMYIEENGATTSYFKNGKAYNYDMEVLNSLTIGRFAYKPRSNGNLSLVYIGEGGDE